MLDDVRKMTTTVDLSINISKTKVNTTKRTTIVYPQMPSVYSTLFLESTDTITNTSLDWNPQGSRRKGRPSNTWTQKVTDNFADAGYSCNKIKTLAMNGSDWNEFVELFLETMEIYKLNL